MQIDLRGDFLFFPAFISSAFEGLWLETKISKKEKKSEKHQELLSPVLNIQGTVKLQILPV